MKVKVVDISTGLEIDWSSDDNITNVFQRGDLIQTSGLDAKRYEIKQIVHTASEETTAYYGGGKPTRKWTGVTLEVERKLTAAEIKVQMEEKKK